MDEVFRFSLFPLFLSPFLLTFLSSSLFLRENIDYFYNVLGLFAEAIIKTLIKIAYIFLDFYINSLNIWRNLNILLSHPIC